MYVRRQKRLAVVLGRKPLRRPAPNTQMLSVLWKRLTSWVTLWKLGAMPQLNTGILQEEWAHSHCQGNSPKFRMKPVLGETFMPLGCVILEGGGNAELRAWKAFGQWINIIRKAFPVTDTPEHARYAARKIVNFIQGSDTLSMKVMDDLSTTERWSLDEESTLLVLSFLKREGSGAQCYMLTERVRRLAERALQKGLEYSRRATHKWLSQALKGGAGPAHRWCGKEDALPDLPLIIRDNQGHVTTDPQSVAEHYAKEWKCEWRDVDKIGFDKETSSIRDLRVKHVAEAHVSGQEIWI